MIHATTVGVWIDSRIQAPTLIVILDARGAYRTFGLLEKLLCGSGRRVHVHLGHKPLAPEGLDTVGLADHIWEFPQTGTPMSTLALLGPSSLIEKYLWTLYSRSQNSCGCREKAHSFIP